MAHIAQQQLPASKPEVEWKTGLCDCFEDASTCCYGFWCCPCLAFTVSNRFGEGCPFPLCDMCTTGIAATFGVPLCAPPAGLSLRAAMRFKYGIKGSLCKDVMVSCFCVICNWCQMHRELKKREETITIINVNETVVQQPAPVMMAPVAYMAQQPIVTVQQPIITRGI